MQTATSTDKKVTKQVATTTVYNILFAVSLVHLLNDSIQSVVTAIFPILRESMSLSYTQLGVIACALNVTASIMQPMIGFYTDKRPKPYLLPIGMCSTFMGMLLLSVAPNYGFILLSVVMVGFGSAVFHPEGSRVAYLAAGNQRGLAQSIFQVGGNSGQTLAPLLTALLFVPYGQFGAIWFTLVAAVAIGIQLYIARWYKNTIISAGAVRKKESSARSRANRSQIGWALTILVVLMFSKMWYITSLTNFYPFYLIDHFDFSIERSQMYLFVFLAAGAVGTFLGGPVADRIGRRSLIWISIIGSIPFALVLPYANELWACVIMVIIGLILLSSFSVIVVYAQELLPGKVGTVSGLLFGLSFGLGGLGSVALGAFADHTSIEFMLIICGFLPLLGLLTLFLPSDAKLREWSQD